MPAKWAKTFQAFGKFFFCSSCSFILSTVSAQMWPLYGHYRRISNGIKISSCAHFFLCISGRFLYDGARIQDDDTPASLDMEDNGASDLFMSMNTQCS